MYKWWAVIRPQAEVHILHMYPPHHGFRIHGFIPTHIRRSSSHIQESWRSLKGSSSRIRGPLMAPMLKFNYPWVLVSVEGPE